ncbi:MAG: metal-binding protein [Sphingobacteriaceae bacterium]|nr:metal-binding protein [Cytophagaceae bacterium]
MNGPGKTREWLQKQGFTLCGNRRLRIYGRLNYASGKRMKPENRVFFKNETEAIAQGYRPCGHCLSEAYRHWKAAFSGNH